MKKLFLSLITFLSLAAFAQDSKVIADPNATVRTLNGSFTAISVSSGIDLYLTQGNEESIAVSASDEKYMARFKTEVENGTLKIYYDNKGVTWTANENRKLKAYVSFKTLEKLHGSAGSEVTVKSNITVENLEMKFSSGSGFDGQVNAKQINVEQNSGSDISISGKADKLTIDVSSGASFKGYDLAVDYCDAKASSGADVKITINKELSAKANSGGGIRYKGAALIRDININSGGLVKKGNS
ncbi:MAG: head GIN domain-containing protein [Ferruginibacter sp.]